MASRHTESAKAEDREFADLVLDLLKRAAHDDVDARAQTAGEDAQRVAAGLTFLKTITNGFLRLDITRGHEGSRRRGAIEALVILNALTEGMDHPVWTFLDGARSRLKQGRSVGANDLFTRALLVGCLGALHKRDRDLTKRAAASLVADHPVMETFDFQPNDVRNWAKRFLARPRRDYFTKVAVRFRRKLLQITTTADQCVIVTAAELLQHRQAPSVAGAFRLLPMNATYNDGTGRPVMRVETSHASAERGRSLAGSLEDME